MAGTAAGRQAGGIAAVKFFESSVHELLQGRTGPVVRDLIRRAQPVVNQAKRNTSGDGVGPNVVTGRLRASIAWRVDQDARGVYVAVGTNVYYGLYLEMGTVNMAPHPWLVRSLSALPR